MNDLQAIHLDQFLTGVSVRVANDPNEYVGPAIFPIFPVGKRHDAYLIHSTQHLKKIDAKRAPGAAAKEVNFVYSKGSYSAEQIALDAFVVDEMLGEADRPPVDPQEDATVNLTDAVMLQREIEVLNVLSDSTQIPDQNVLSGGSLWSNYTTSTPLTDIRAGKAAVRANGILRTPNMFSMEVGVEETLVDHPSIKTIKQWWDQNALTEGGLPPIIRGLRVNVSRAYMDTAVSGATPTYSAVFSKVAAIHYTDPTPGLRKITLGWIFEAPDAATGAGGFSTRKWREDKRGGWQIRVSNTFVAKVVAPGAAHVFSPAIA